GPATEPSTTSGLAFRRASKGSAMSRGFLPAALASTMAALVAMSPCAASRGGSAVMAEKSSADGSSPAACMAFSAPSTSPVKGRWGFMGRGLLPIRRALSLIEVEQPAMLVEGVAVGHAGDVIGDQAGPGRPLGCLRPLPPRRRQAIGFGEQEPEQVHHH